MKQFDIINPQQLDDYYSKNTNLELDNSKYKDNLFRECKKEEISLKEKERLEKLKKITWYDILGCTSKK